MDLKRQLEKDILIAEVRFLEAEERISIPSQMSLLAVPTFPW